MSHAAPVCAEIILGRRKVPVAGERGRHGWRSNRKVLLFVEGVLEREVDPNGSPRLESRSGNVLDKAISEAFRVDKL